VAGQDWFEKDFYATLGVPKEADAAAIKKAYRKLARSHHPDANGGDDSRFKEVGEAYSVLSDPEQRQQYDAIRQMSHGGARFAPGGAGGGGGGGFEDLFGGLFGGAGGAPPPRGGRSRFATDAGGMDLEDLLRSMGGTTGGGGPFGGATSAPRRGADVQAATTLAFRSAVVGSTVTLRTPDGRSVTARIPAGVKDGQTIRLRGKGSAGPSGSGDLLIKVTVAADPVFTRHGLDLAVTVPISFPEAALGGQVSVPALDDEGQPTTVRLKIAPGTPSGRTLRVKGRGVRTPSATGDLRVTVQVVVPQRLDDEARAAVEAYAAATSDHDPRADLSARAGA
jgi:molecular chaperone DnaJ